MSDDKLILDTVSLWDEICKKGLEPGEKGRDEALLNELKKRLKLKEGDIREQLKHVKIEEFIYAFFGIIEPFAKMYAEIYSIMQQFGARRAKENILVKFDFSFPGGKLEFDINKFKENYELLRRVRERHVIWTPNDFNKVFKLIDIIWQGVKDWQYAYVRYERGVNFKLPDVPYFQGELYDVLIKVREAVQGAVELVDSESDIDQYPLLKSLEYILTDLVPCVVQLLIQDAARLANIEPQKAKEAVEYFEKEIWSKLQFRINEKTVKELLDILDLPFWRYRWYLYEVWATMHTIDALADIDISLNVDSAGTLAVEVGKTTEIAIVHTEKGDLKVVAQLKTPVVGIQGRKAIKPDLRICIDPVNDPNNTLLVIELKQRKRITRRYLSELISAYEKGCLRSVKNYFLNYDALSSELITLSTTKSQLIGDFNPSRPTVINWYKKDIVTQIIRAGYKPVMRFDAILFDISGSMTGRYNSAEVQETIKALLMENRRARIFLFNTELIKQQDTDPSTIVESLKNTWGGTTLEPCLKQLLEFKNIKRILIITDGEYGEAPSLSKFEAVQCQPTVQEISSFLRKKA
jgi:hypothetical protein